MAERKYAEEARDRAFIVLEVIEFQCNGSAACASEGQPRESA